MFRTKSNPANNVDECVEPGKVSEELWSWSESVEKWGGVLCGLIIAYGLINAFYLFFEVHDDFAIFLTQIVSCVF